ncbi:hypothetical protein B0H12DRAFT_1162803 [Mycena haematopus]|nr:hypothetical protein B0H12DRAFT_1162803 [Mycena haematopus]
MRTTGTGKDRGKGHSSSTTHPRTCTCGAIPFRSRSLRPLRRRRTPYSSSTHSSIRRSTRTRTHSGRRPRTVGATPSRSPSRLRIRIPSRSRAQATSTTEEDGLTPTRRRTSFPLPTSPPPTWAWGPRRGTLALAPRGIGGGVYEAVVREEEGTRRRTQTQMEMEMRGGRIAGSSSRTLPRLRPRHPRHVAKTRTRSRSLYPPCLPCPSRPWTNASASLLLPPRPHITPSRASPRSRGGRAIFPRCRPPLLPDRTASRSRHTYPSWRTGSVQVQVAALVGGRPAGTSLLDGRTRCRGRALRGSALMREGTWGWTGGLRPGLGLGLGLG